MTVNDEEDDTGLSVVSRMLLRENIDVLNMNLWIEGTITHKSFIKFDKQLRLLEATTSEPICVSISSGGGDVYAMFAFIDRIKSCKNNIITIGTGLVASAAVPILAAGHIRSCTKNVQFMHHTTSYASPFDRLANNKGQYEHTNELEIRICEYMHENTKQTAYFWKANGKHVDFYFDAEKALIWGLVDEII